MRTNFILFVVIATMIFISGCSTKYTTNPAITAKDGVVKNQSFKILSLLASDDVKKKNKEIIVLNNDHNNEITFIGDFKHNDKVVAAIISLNNDDSSMTPICFTRDERVAGLESFCKNTKIEILDCQEEAFIDCITEKEDEFWCTKTLFHVGVCLVGGVALGLALNAIIGSSGSKRTRRAVTNTGGVIVTGTVRGNNQ